MTKLKRLLKKVLPESWILSFWHYPQAVLAAFFFMKLCSENKIEQKFTKVRTPRTNGKAERVIRTLMEVWHNKTKFKSSAHRKQELIRFVNYYNTVKPHKGINNMTPMEKLISYFYPSEL